MYRRRLLLFALLGLLVVTAVCAVVVWPRPTAITRANEARIREGMTRDEVETILGGPPRDETTGPTDWDPEGLGRGTGYPLPARVTAISEWFSDEVMIRIAFDAEGRAEWIAVCPLRRIYPGLVPTVRHWLRL